MSFAGAFSPLLPLLPAPPIAGLLPAVCATTEPDDEDVIHLPAKLAPMVLAQELQSVDWIQPGRTVNPAWVDAWKAANGTTNDPEMLDALLKHGTPDVYVTADPLPTQLYRQRYHGDDDRVALEFVKWTDERLYYREPGGEKDRYFTADKVQRLLSVGVLHIDGPRPDWATPVRRRLDIVTGERVPVSKNVKVDEMIQQVTEKLAA